MEGASICNHIRWLPSQAKRTENARFEAGGGMNPNGTRMSRRPDVKARKRMQAEGRNITSNKTAGSVPGHQINQRWEPVVAPLYDISLAAQHNNMSFSGPEKPTAAEGQARLAAA